MRKEEIYSKINDSINKYIDGKIYSFAVLTKYSFLLDTTICVNNTKDKLVSVLLIKCNYFKNCLQDDLRLIYGVKIKNEWYYIFGPTIVLPNNGKPTSFEKLHEIALEEIFSGYLKENKKTGEWEINEAFFADMTSSAFGGGKDGPKTQEEWNKVYLKIVSDKWKWPKDTTNYERLSAREMNKMGK